MITNWVVMKFGGTSVSGLRQWAAMADLLQHRIAAGYRVLVVCSAVAGVTDALTVLAKQPGSQEKLALVLDRHKQLADELGVSETSWLQQAESKLCSCAKALIEGGGHAAEAELLALGEWLSTRIGAEYLRQFMAVSWVDVREHLKVKDEPELSSARRWLSGSCEPGEDAVLRQKWEQLARVVLTQGFVASTADGRTTLLGRGGSDTSAAILAGRLGASELEIWTDVPGLFTADPRLVSEARLLMELGYSEALEMAASGAKVVHPRCIRAAEATATPVVIRDSARPQISGTRIANTVANIQSVMAAGVKAITCQKDMVVLLLQNTDSRREVGFLARVFGVFYRLGLSVDLVATSETTTTVAINGPANHLDEQSLSALETELQTQCLVEVFPHCVCVNLVGSAVRTALSRLPSTMQFFDDHPLLMLSQSANDLCLSLLIDAADHEVLLRQMHAALIPSGAEPPAGVFGARWIEILENS